MAFTLVEAPGGGQVSFDDAASYAFNQSGFLVVVHGDGRRFTYAHHAWHHIEDEPKSGW